MRSRPIALAAVALLLAGCAAPAGTRATGEPSARPTMTTPSDPASLAGTRWQGEAPGSVDPKNAPRLEFLPQGRIAGYTGCNMMSGTWRMEGGEVRFGPVIATKRGCLGPEGEVEKRVLAALGEGSRAVREGSKLVVVGAGGERYTFAAITDR